MTFVYSRLRITGLTAMPEPSDPTAARSVNRIAFFVSPADLLFNSERVTRSDGEGACVLTDLYTRMEESLPETGQVVFPEFDDIAKRLDWESCYRMWYDMIRTRLHSTGDREEVRNHFTEIAVRVGEKGTILLRALEDVLGDCTTK